MVSNSKEHVKMEHLCPKLFIVVGKLVYIHIILDEGIMDKLQLLLLNPSDIKIV